MKRLFKKATLLATAFALAASISVSSSAAEFVDYDNYSSNSVKIEELSPTEIMIRQEPALKAYDELYSHFEQDENGNYIYPYNYAGEYIDDNYNLVLLVTDDNVELFKNAVSEYDCIKIKKVAYSYSELQQTIQNVADEFGNMFVSSYVDIMNNRAVIEVNEDVRKKVRSKSFDFTSTLSNNDCLSINWVDCTNDVQTTVSGGTVICGTLSGTVAAGGRDGNKNALLTCGHLFNAVDDDVYLATPNSTGVTKGSKIGTVKYRTFDNDSYGDFSIVELDDGVESSSKVLAGNTTYTLSGIKNSVPINTTLFKYGYKTGISQVVVTNTNARIHVKDGDYNLYVKGMTQAKLISGGSQDGDSGGPYLAYENGKWYLAGIHSGSKINSDGTSTNVVNFTPCGYINASFSLKNS